MEILSFSCKVGFCLFWAALQTTPASCIVKENIESANSGTSALKFWETRTQANTGKSYPRGGSDAAPLITLDAHKKDVEQNVLTDRKKQSLNNFARIAHTSEIIFSLYTVFYCKKLPSPDEFM